MAIRVYVIDEHAVVRKNLVRRLSSAPGILVVGESSNARTGLEEINVLRPDVLLIEVKMKSADGVDVCSQAVLRDNRLKVAVITSYIDAEELRRAQQAGVAAYLLKDLDTTGLVERLKKLVLSSGVSRCE